MKSFKKLSLLKYLFVALVITSCSDDDDNTAAMQSTKIYTSNNANGNITVFDFTDSQNVTPSTLVTTSTAADGVYFDSSTSNLFQASRSNNNLEGYADISDVTGSLSISTDFASTTDMQSPREVAVNGNFYVVADNADVDANPDTPDGRLFVYQFNGSSFSLRNTITTDFKLWGITFIGNDLYAVVDADDELAMFSNFLNTTTNTTLSATKRVVVEGIVRTHGLTYDAATDVMIMTDIGSAANTQDDGGFHVINNFMSVFANVANNGTLALSNQTRIAGSNTAMGNPVDVAYDGATGIVYIAEAGNNGGRLLAFNNVSAGGNLTPFYNMDLAAASAVFLSKN